MRDFVEVAAFRLEKYVGQNVTNIRFYIGNGSESFLWQMSPNGVAYYYTPNGTHDAWQVIFEKH